MINGAYGNILRVSPKEDISLNTNRLEIRSPSPYIQVKNITVSEGLSVGVIDKDIDGVIYKTNEYVEYKLQEGDVFSAGEWEVCFISLTPSGENKILGPLLFSVSEC